MLADGINAIQPKRLVFPTQKNTFAIPSTINGGFKRMQKLCGVGHVISAHGLRHTWSTVLAADDAELKTRTAITGHADATTEEMVYTHTTPSQIRDAASAAAAYLRKVD